MQSTSWMFQPINEPADQLISGSLQTNHSNYREEDQEKSFFRHRNRGACGWGGPGTLVPSLFSMDVVLAGPEPPSAALRITSVTAIFRCLTSAWSLPEWSRQSVAKDPPPWDSGGYGRWTQFCLWWTCPALWLGLIMIMRIWSVLIVRKLSLFIKDNYQYQ